MFHLRRFAVMAMLAIFVAGCGDGGASGGGEKVIRLWHIMNYSGPREVLEAAVARFEAAHPGVRVEVDLFSNDDYKTKLALEMASGNEPDVFFTWGAGGQTGQYIAQGKVADLTAHAEAQGWNDRLLDAAANLCRRDGKLYCAPLDLSVVVLWCNRELFERHGVALPRTWGELETACRAFVAAGVTPIGLGNYDAWPGAFWYCYLASRLGGTALFERAAAGDGADFAAAPFVRAGERLRALVESGAFSRDGSERKEDEARKLFVRGKSAMYLGGSWLVGQIVRDPEAAPFLKGLTALPFPEVPGAAPDGAKTVLGGVNCGFAVASSSREPELAMRLVDFLTDEVTAREWCAIGRIPACRVPDEWLGAFPQASREAYAILLKAVGMQPYYDQYLPAALTVVHKNTARDLFAGRLTPQQAAERMRDEAKK